MIFLIKFVCALIFSGIALSIYPFHFGDRIFWVWMEGWIGGAITMAICVYHDYRTYKGR